MDYDKLTVDDLVDQAEKFEEEGLFGEAFGIWSIAIKRESDPFLLCQFGSSAMMLSKWSEAEDAFLSALEMAPEIPNAYSHLGVLYIEKGNPLMAQDYLKRSLKIEETANRFTLLGAAQLDLGMTEAARESFHNALNLDPSYEEAYYNLAVTLRYERPAEAIALFQKALDLDSQYAVAHREVGWTLRIMSQYPEAEYHLRRAIEIDGLNGWAYIYLGNLMWTTGNLKAAEQSFKQALETWRDSSIPYWCLAHFYENQKRTQEAENLYEKALEIDADDIEANLRFGVYLKDIDEYARAKVYLERAHTLDPNDKRVGLLLSELNDAA